MPALPSTPPVARSTYVAALNRYCNTTFDAVERLGRTRPDEADPTAPIARIAERFRAGLERFGTVTPPRAFRDFHLLTLAAAREAADRLDDGVRLGREGDVDAATTALDQLPSLLPGNLPAGLRREARSCVLTYSPEASP